MATITIVRFHTAIDIHLLEEVVTIYPFDEEKGVDK